MRLKYLFGEFELNPATRELVRNGRPVSLRARSLECLIYLIEHRDRAVGRDELISAVWGRVDVGDTVVAQTLLRARKALDDTGNQQGMIRTLPRFGYRWVAPVQEVPLAPDEVPPTVEVETETDTGDPRHVDEAVPRIDVAAPTHETTDTRRRWPRGWSAFAVLLVAIGLGFFLYLRSKDTHAPAMADDLVLVMPMTVVPIDSENAWVRLGAMDYMAERLRSSGINVLPSEQALRTAAAIEGDAPDVDRRKLLALSGARWIAQPEALRERDGWRVRLQVIEGGKARSLEARGDTALAATAAAADAWLRQLGRRDGAAPPPTPLAERLHRIDADILAGRLTEARRVVRSLPPAERSDPRFLLREAKLEFRAANLDAAATLYQQVLDKVTAADPDTKIGALIGLGTAFRAQGQLDAADQRFTQALDALESLPTDRVDARMFGVAYQGRGIVRVQRGEIDAGIRDMGQARVWLQRSGDRITLGVIGHNLGKAEAIRGDYLQALLEFDRSIETFERFRVHDYLANSLYEKAELQLALARPAEAWETIRRADAFLPKLESDELASEVLSTKARVLLALGRLREAGDTLAALAARGVQDTDPRRLELSLRLHLARGEVAQAGRLAAQGPVIADASRGLLLAAVQAALRAGDVPLAEQWMAGVARGEGTGDRAFALALARALVLHAGGDRAGALAQAERAAALVGRRASPDIEIQAGVAQVMLLLDLERATAASAIVGELEKYAESDYRVAWVMPKLYQALGDPRAAASARVRAMALGGERDPAVAPLL